MGRLQGTSEHRIFTSYQDMLDDLWDNRVLSGENRSERAALLLNLAEQMAEVEELWIPLAQLDEQRDVIEGLVADGILAIPEGGRRVGFQHQTLFEHVRARAFAAGGISLTQHTVDRQNGLFVRPTVWSSLKYLREASLDQYEREISSLVNAGLRSHLQHLLIDFLGQVEEPTDLEQMLFQRWLDDADYRTRAITAIANNEGWFHRLEETHLPVLMKLPIGESWSVVLLLRGAWPFARMMCLQLMRKHWLHDPSRDHLTISVLQDLTVWDTDVVRDVCTIVERCNIHDYYVMHLATIVSATSPDLAPQIIATALQNKLEKADEEGDPESDPLPENATEQDRIVQAMTYRPKARYAALIRQSSEYYELPAIAEADPAAFLEAVWPWFLSVLKPLLYEPHHIMWQYRDGLPLDFELEGDRLIMVAIETAVRLFAKDSPAKFDVFLEKWDGFDALVVQQLLCRGVAERAIGSPEVGINFLTADPRRLYLGRYGGHS